MPVAVAVGVLERMLDKQRATRIIADSTKACESQLSDCIRMT